MDPNVNSETPTPMPETPTSPVIDTPVVPESEPAPVVSSEPVTSPMAEPTPMTPIDATPAVNPGQTLGIASLVVSLIGGGIIGIILGVMGINKSKKAGLKNPLALAGVLIGAVGILIALTWLVIWMLAS